jgi:DNA helicase-2/ATP-dependent DNA helicase PcrA
VDGRALLADLDPEQRRAVTTPTQPLCILAGAGSGKTRVLTRRIAYRVHEEPIDARHVLALTFTRKAAEELRSRLGQMGLRDRPHAGTFHALAWAQVRIWYRDELRRPMPGLLGYKAKVLADLPSRGSLPVPELAAEIEWAGARSLTPERYPHAAMQEDRRPSTSFEHIAGLMQEYARAKARGGVIDFDDMLRLCAELFEGEPRFAQAQRWRFRHLFVDEYQDVNPLQHRVLRGWLGDRTDLCVVGDPNQAIYRWNGADAGFLRDFAREHAGAEVVDLRRNYRSTPQILHVAASVLGPSSRLGYIAHRPAGEIPTYRSLADERAEALEIAREVRLLHQPNDRWSRQAILVRTNGQMGTIETALAREGIPFRARTGQPLTADPHVRAALRHVTPAAPQPFQVVVADLALLVSEALADDDADRHRALESVLRMARELEASDAGASVQDLWSYLRSAGGEGDLGRHGDAVEILTFHAAKGLEWPIVHIAGLEDGFVPIGRGKSAESEAEERRLLHVAMTRATQHLRLWMAYERTIRGSVVRRKESPYAGPIHRALAELRAAERIDPAGGLEISRRALAGARREELDRPLLDALHAWRHEVARRAGTAPAVVASDRVLSDVAHRRPADRDQLAAVLGIGPAVLDAHGDDILAIVSSHAAPAGAP